MLSAPFILHPGSYCTIFHTAQRLSLHHPHCCTTNPSVHLEEISLSRCGWICNMFGNSNCCDNQSALDSIMKFILECNAVFHRASWLLPFQLPHYPCHSSFCFGDVLYFHKWCPSYELQSKQKEVLKIIRRKIISSPDSSFNTNIFK